jgi:hypothetical protein
LLARAEQELAPPARNIESTKMNLQTKILMKHKTTFSYLLLMLLSLTVTGNAFANTTWYVDGVHGSDSSNCQSPTTACKTIGHAIALALSGDSIRVAAATYIENLTIGISNQG